MPSFLIIGVYFAAFGLIPGLVFALVSLLGGRRRPVTSLTASVLTVAVVVTVICEVPDPAISSIRIDAKAEPLVGSGAFETTIKGSVSPADARVAVLVHWADDDKWWVQDKVQVGHFGEWKTNLDLSTEKQGAGQHFQVVAIASTYPWFIDVLRGYWFLEGGTVSRPPALPRSEIVTIWREK